MASNDVSSNPFVSAETLKACALIGLHLVAAEGEAGSSGSPSPDSGDSGGKAVLKARSGSALARQARPPLAVSCVSTTTSAGPLKSSGKIGRARW